MKKEKHVPQKFGSLTEALQAMGLPKPQHPLVALIGAGIDVQPPAGGHVLSFYKISYKPRLSGRIRYGQGHYDFDEGGMLFASPGQIIGGNEELNSGACSQYTLLIHPDLLWNYPLARKIRQYGFFSYAANEALHLSEAEKAKVMAIFQNIGEELSDRIDELSQDVIIAQVELLLTYAERFYKRQFITRKAVNSDLLGKLESILSHYFAGANALGKGLPSVQSLAEQLNISPSYLSDMLRALTGQNAQQHIHNWLIEKAKEQLSTTKLSVSEVAYALGFEHPQSFSRLFKARTELSPLEFRKTFN
ncbi:helix-turn-helix transcriptional regulator [Mucilaginibacter sabulilitoris]|uniref:Helix-turn-helix transcriptional regulator n=1 Tax=Mucilaginibacter sabulilitoris TaxID=1173583 RepID=A0ABZ0TVA3_9SPHI|nr:helix-turn-helix transcriptional regulator [Mucilaginibacter sabulilitoris]WPU97034.1 helix-turn-helix transcriptional regulator [Mucilaginibacter sabulilitoris]